VFTVVTHNVLLIAPDSREVSLRAVGIGFTAVALLLAFFSQVFARSRVRVAPAQMTAGLYAVLTAAGAAVIAAVVAVGFPHAAGDRLSVDGILLVIALVLLLGGLLARYAWRGIGDGRLSYGLGLMWPVMACIGLDTGVMGDVWLTAGQHDATGAGAGSIHTGALVLAGFTLITAAAIMAEPLVMFARMRSTSPLFRPIVIPAVVGAAIELALILLRGPNGWYTGSHAAGLDLLMANVAIGVTVYLVTLVRERTQVAAVPSASERWDAEYVRAA
jgi:hypothetical protein